MHADVDAGGEVGRVYLHALQVVVHGCAVGLFAGGDVDLRCGAVDDLVGGSGAHGRIVGQSVNFTSNAMARATVTEKSFFIGIK